MLPADVRMSHLDNEVDRSAGHLAKIVEALRGRQFRQCRRRAIEDEIDVEAVLGMAGELGMDEAADIAVADQSQALAIPHG